MQARLRSSSPLWGQVRRVLFVGLLILSWGALYFWTMLITEGWLAPWDTAPIRPPAGYWQRSLNDFFESGVGAYTPTAIFFVISGLLFAYTLNKTQDVGATSLAFGSRMVILFLLTLLVVACADDTFEPTDEEAAAIYATVIRQIYTEDDTHGGTLRPPLLYVVGTTDDSAGDPTGGEGGAATLISPAVRQRISEQLADLPAEIEWIESPDEVEREPDTGMVSGGGVIITLGNITPQEQDVIHVPASIYIAPLGAGGQTYVLEKVDGVWTITGNTGVEWIS